MRMTAAAALLFLLAGGATAQDGSADWRLTLTHKPLDVITVPYQDGTARSFYYMFFTLENKTSTDAPLAVHAKADVGEGHVHVATPHADAEEFLRRISRTKDLKNVQEINRMGTLKAGERVRGVAVFGTFHREWSDATVTIAGLEARAIHARIRDYGDAGYTLAHRAYFRHNRAVKEKAGKDAAATDVYAVISHAVIWTMKFSRKGDEFAPHLDPIIPGEEGWDVIETAIVLKKS